VTSAFDEPPNATPLAPSERQGLRQYWITSRNDLNIAEQDNILKGMAWARKQKRKSPTEILDNTFSLKLHKHLFGDVWSWAGTYRTTERNIGIDSTHLNEAIHQMFGDITYWIDNSVFSHDETAVRLHHRLVSIHPFPNGNGRHSRLMADLLVEKLGGQAFSWGGGTLNDASALRAAYITALRAADAHDITPLLVFARS
jgi:Fic-DOC domain mobile mystery protein B